MPEATPPKDAAEEHRSLLRGAGVFGALTAASRLLGIVRDMALTAVLSAAARDAFLLALTVPNMFRNLFGEGALTNGFVPLYVERLEKGDRAGAGRLASVVGTALAVFLAALAAAGALASFAGRHAFGGHLSEKTTLALRLMEAMAPFLPLICLYAFLMAVLASHRRFAASGAGPAVWNLAILGGLFAGWRLFGSGSREAAFLVAGGVVAGGALMVLLEVPGLLRCGVPLRPALDLRDTGFRAVLAGMAPVLVGTGVFQLNMILNRLFAWGLVKGDGPQSWLALSNVLVMAPLGAVAVAMSTAALPALSALHARGDREGFGRTFTGALRMGLFLLMPAAAYFMVAGEPVVRLLYERGGFAPAETPPMARVLFWSALAMVPAVASMLASRALYAMKLPRIPARIAVISVIVNIALSLLLVRSDTVLVGLLRDNRLAGKLGGPEAAAGWVSGAAGLALASAVAGIVQMALLLVALRRERKDLDLGPVGVCAVRSLGMTVLTALALHYWVIPSVPPSGEGFMIPLQRAVAPAAAAVFLYTLIASLLGIEEYREFWRAVRGKKKPGKKDGEEEDDNDDEDNKA